MLLPTEADLCNALGITEEEYFQFLESVAAKVKERPEAYGLVPDLVAGPAVIAPFYAGGSLTFLGQIAVGIALTAASVLLAPKPPSMRQGTNERTADIGGTKRFAPQFSFNSVQDLANLGDLVPLVFTNRQTIDGIKYGGVRVNSQLLWSQMVSLGRYQQLKILALFSLGKIARKPDLKGYAIGDLLLENYHADKIFKDSTGNIPFLTDGGIIPNDTFKIDNLRHFCGTRNPTTQATFGLSNPMPNATWYYLPYQLVRTKSDISDDDSRPAGRIALKKRRKLLGAWPMGAGFMNGGTTAQKLGNVDLQKGLEIHYQIVGSTDDKGTPFSGIAYQQDAPPGSDLTSDPHGLEDVNAATKTVREATDSYLAIGEQYMAGSALVTCYDIREDDETITGQPWNGKKVRAFFFRVVEPGRYEAVLNAELATHLGNPYWDTNGDFFTVRSGDQNKFFYEQNHQDIFPPNSRYALQKVTLGTISNNRKCHITEIGIKSKVFKEIQFANVNSKPSDEKLFDIYDNNSSLQLGNINKFITRYSFFKLEVRKVGEDDWKWLKPTVDTNVHTGLFCVRGNTPEFQYNYIRIDQPTLDQYEYRFYPCPGAAVVKEVQAYEERERHNPVNAIILNANGIRTPGAVKTFECDGYYVRYAGDTFYALTKQRLSNTEWNLGEPSKNKLQTASRNVTGLSKTQEGSRNDYSISNLPIARPIQTIFTNKLFYPGFGGYVIGSGANHTVIAEFENQPAAGFTTWSLYINRVDVTPNTEGYDGPAWGQSIIKGPGDNSPVEFHYTSLDGRGGKFIPGSNQTANLYGVTKIEQVELIATPTFSGEVDIKTNEDDGSGLKANVVVYALGTEWFAQWNISDIGQNYADEQIVFIEKDDINVPYNEDTESDKISFTVDVNTSGENIYSDDILSELNPYDAAADFWQYEGDRSSHLDGPEHQITYCNEIVETEGSIRAEGVPATYEKLAYAGLRIDSSKEWTNFSQFSAYFKEGIEVESLIDGTKKATSLFPEIAYALLTDKTLGAGAVISEASVDKANMTIAAKFCKANRLFWDGMISDKVNLREFIYQQALYYLLDFTIIGGRFSLFPAVPFDEDKYDAAGNLTYSGTYEIRREKPVLIKAMFTDGNISDLNVSFLPPEDRQAFKANVLFRKEQENGFPEIQSTVVRLFGTEHADDPLETFDLSGFCTSREAALLFAKYTLALRKHLDHTISFKTAPHYINGVRPGDYIRVFSTTQHVQRFNNGAILNDGTVVSKDTISGSKTFYYWNPSTIINNEIMPVTEATENFSNPLPAQYRGALFTIKESEASDQCYKVESITFGDDGLVELSGSYAELTSDGKLAMLQNWESEDPNIFAVDEEI